MFKRLALTALFLAIGVAAAFAAPMPGKVVAVDKQDVRVIVTGKLPAWAKKGASVKFLGARATITGVASDTLTIRSPRAAKTKAGEAVTLDQFKATAAGC